MIPFSHSWSLLLSTRILISQGSRTQRCDFKTTILFDSITQHRDLCPASVPVGIFAKEAFYRSCGIAVKRSWSGTEAVAPPTSWRSLGKITSCVEA